MKTRSEAGGRAPEAKKKKRDVESVKIPVDVVNEVVLLAAAIVLLGSDPDAAGKLLRLPADSFFGSGHAPAWTTLQELHRRKLAYDPATVRQLSAGEVDTDSLDGYVRDRPEPPPNLAHHVERVKWDRARVECVQGPLTAFIETLKDGQAEPSKLLALSRQIPLAFQSFGDKRYLRDPQALVREQSKVLTERREGRAIYTYGIPALDLYGEGDVIVRSGREESVAGEPRMIPGTAPGQVTTFTGSSGGGKTTIVARMILAQYEARRKTLYGAWEQGSGMTAELLATMSLGWSRTEVSIGRYTAEEQRLLEEEMERIGEFVRFFELPFGRKRGEKQLNDENLDLIQEHIGDTGCDVFVADLFHLAISEHGYGQEDDALYRMKAITLEQRCHTLQVQQLNIKKSTEGGVADRPTLEAVRGTGAWVAVSDTMLGSYIPALSKQVVNDRIEIIVLKQRYGIYPQAVECEFDPEFGYIGAGKTVPYVRPGEQDDSGDLLGQSLTRKSKFGGGTRGNKRR